MMIQRSLRPLLSRGILRRIPLAAADSCLRRGFSSSSESTSSIPDPATHVEKEVNRQGSQTATTVSVDRSGLYNPPQHSHEPSSDSDLVKHLKSIIKFRGGPISVAEYMSEVLTNPKSGFYINRDVFGAGGDFITSPEVSQMFGEMVGVWAMCLWEQMGQPEKVNLVELGPGRGTLMADLLRGTSKFEAFTKSLSIHLVECSPTLRKSQFETLKCVLDEGDATGTTTENSMSSLVNAPVTWHNAFDQIPSGLPTIVIAHEFYDALPVHQFQRAPLGWCEKMIDIEKDSTFRFVLSPQPTPAKLHLMRRLKWAAAEEFAQLDHIEVCPQAMELTEEISKRLGVDGGGALIIDYGQNEIVSDSLQAIRQHKFVGVLDNPGSADLSAYVDFAMVRRSAKEASDNVSVHGPISQSQFLGSLGINFRAEALLQKCTEKQAEALQAGYWRLVGDGEAPFWDGPPELAPIGMGTRYLALVIVNKNQGSPVPFQ